jgi:hypothetical protein
MTGGGPSSSGSEVHRKDPLRLRRKLVSWQLARLGRGDHLLVDELASVLRYLTLGVGLLSAGSRSLPLQKSMLSLRGEHGVRSRCKELQWNHRHGLSGRGVLWPR